MSTGCIVGVDYGEKRIGFAVSDEMQIIAMPLRVSEVSSRAGAVESVVDVCSEKSPARIVVGMPLNMDGSIGPKGKEVELFVKELEARLDVPVVTWDERLSSRQVERTLIESDVSRAKRKKVIDKLSAQVVLQCYLDAG